MASISRPAKIYIRSGAGGPGRELRREVHSIWRTRRRRWRQGRRYHLRGRSGAQYADDRFRYSQHFKAQRGIPGMGKNPHRRRRRRPRHQSSCRHPECIADDDKPRSSPTSPSGPARCCCAAATDAAISATRRRPIARRRHGMGWPGDEMWIWRLMARRRGTGRRAVLGQIDLHQSCVTNTKAEGGRLPLYHHQAATWRGAAQAAASSCSPTFQGSSRARRKVPASATASWGISSAASVLIHLIDATADGRSRRGSRRIVQGRAGSLWCRA